MTTEENVIHTHTHTHDVNNMHTHVSFRMGSNKRLNHILIMTEEKRTIIDIEKGEGFFKTNYFYPSIPRCPKVLIS